MKENKMSTWERTIYSVLILLMFGSIQFAIGFQSPSSAQNISLIPEIEKLIDAKTTTIVLLYGYICVGCPIGNYIYSVRDRQDTLFIVPPQYKPNEVENLRRAFSLKCKIVKGDDPNIEVFVNKLAEQLKISKTQRNLILEIKDRTIIKIRYY
jgi:hypothetical protein